MNPANPFSIILFITSVIMFFIGIYQTKWSQKYCSDLKILSKSKRAVRTAEHFSLSVAYSGKLYLKFAIFLFLLGIFSLFLDVNRIIGFILSITIILIGIVVIGIMTEKKLIEKFGK